MESRPHCLSFLYAVLCILASILFTHSDARLMVHIWKKHQGSNLHEKLKTTDRIGFDGDPYTLDSPFYLLHSDSLSPLLPQPDHSPPFTPQSPSNPLPPPATSPEHGFNPPSIFSSPPQHQPNPPKNVSTPPKQVPGQPISEPPVLNPPPRSTPHKGSRSGTWCVAKPTVPDSLIQAAMDYACGSGADCKSIQPNQACFQPNTMISHASYAFNSYWQNKKGSGGTCDFGGTAMLVTVDPFGKCQFRNN
ncbi:hypothetical protein GOBAR_AA21402 [Gossypium barbadense]|uniref:X8 domain-containing protein n=1 Tax=Gossypium barbadense TaxID=3634 RepID=A0A2P5X7F2_GOSBA|nr:hypothetical protein GOBAR_AA21402 [Gossypium barbadense]